MMTNIVTKVIDDEVFYQLESYPEIWFKVENIGFESDCLEFDVVTEDEEMDPYMDGHFVDEVKTMLTKMLVEHMKTWNKT